MVAGKLENASNISAKNLPPFTLLIPSPCYWPWSVWFSKWESYITIYELVNLPNYRHCIKLPMAVYNFWTAKSHWLKTVGYSIRHCCWRMAKWNKLSRLTTNTFAKSHAYMMHGYVYIPCCMLVTNQVERQKTFYQWMYECLHVLITLAFLSQPNN